MASDDAPLGCAWGVRRNLPPQKAWTWGLTHGAGPGMSPRYLMGNHRVRPAEVRTGEAGRN